MSTSLHRRRRRAVIALAGVSLLLLLATLATVRPVAAAGEEWSTYSMTYGGTAAGRQGLVGASGGLVAFSGGPGVVAGRLDAAPSGSAEASSVEPGTMGRLVVGQANGAGGPEVDADVLTARATLPGEQAEDSATQAGPQEAGPLTIVGAQADAAVTPTASTSRASVATFRVAGQGSAEALATAARAWRTTFVDGDGGLAGAQQPRVAATSDMLRIEGAHGDGRAVADVAARQLTSTVEVGAARVVVQGALVLEGVVGRATAAAGATDRTSSATMDVGSVTLGGVPLTLDEQGLSIAENQVVTGQDVVAANEQLQGVLAQAGIEVRLLGTVQQTDDTTARASSGGVAISVTTVSNDAVPRNVVGVVVGRGEATLSAEAASAGAIVTSPGSDTTAPTPTQGSASGSDLPSSTSPSAGAPVDAPAPATADEPAAPSVAAPAADTAAPPTEEPQVVAAGVRMDRRTAYAGFAAWMLFTSTLPLLGSVLLGQRP